MQPKIENVILCSFTKSVKNFKFSITTVVQPSMMDKCINLCEIDCFVGVLKISLSDFFIFIGLQS